MIVYSLYICTCANLQKNYIFSGGDAGMFMWYSLSSKEARHNCVIITNEYYTYQSVLNEITASCGVRFYCF